MKTPWFGESTDPSVPELAKEVGASSVAVRNWLKKNIGPLPDSQKFEWRLPASLQRQIRDHFCGGGTPAAPGSVIEVLAEILEEGVLREVANEFRDTPTRRGFDLADHAGIIEELMERSEKGENEDYSLLSLAVKLLGLPGHEDGINEDLAASQLARERVLLVHYDALYAAWKFTFNSIGWNPELNDADEATLRRDWGAFVEGRSCLRVLVPSLNFSGGFTWEELRPHVDGDPARWEDAAERREEVFWGYKTATADAEEPQEIHLNVPALWNDTMGYDFWEAMLDTLAAKGLFRGPCQKCGIKRWPVVWRDQKSKPGRKPLGDTLCPPCELEHIRRREASKQRAIRRRKSEQEPGTI